MKRTPGNTLDPRNGHAKARYICIQQYGAEVGFIGRLFCGCILDVGDYCRGHRVLTRRDDVMDGCGWM